MQGQLDDSEARTIKGALLFSDIRVEKVMTKAASVFAVREDERLTFDLISRIFHVGHSRVPVVSSTDPDVVVGILLTKVRRFACGVVGVSAGLLLFTMSSLLLRR